MRTFLPSRGRSTWFAVGDAAALLIFVLIGLRGHRVETLEGFLRNAVPLLGAWFLVAWAGGTYLRPGWRSLLRNWIVAVPVGMVLRTVTVGSPSEVSAFLVFLGVGLAFTLLFLVLGRLLVRLLVRTV